VAVGVTRHWRAAHWPSAPKLLHEALRLPQRQVELGRGLGGSSPTIGRKPLGGLLGRR